MTQEELPKIMQKWWNHQFSSGGTAGPDYRAFEHDYGLWLRKELKGYTGKMHKNHYEFAVVLTKKGVDGNPDRYIYVGISDVRFSPREWATHVLVHTMAHPKDWTGGPNCYCHITELKEMVDRLAA